MVTFDHLESGIICPAPEQVVYLHITGTVFEYTEVGVLRKTDDQVKINFLIFKYHSNSIINI